MSKRYRGWTDGLSVRARNVLVANAISLEEFIADHAPVVIRTLRNCGAATVLELELHRETLLKSRAALAHLADSAPRAGEGR